MVSIQVVATPTRGLARSSSVKPIALSMDRAPARSGPSVRAAECRLAGSLGRSYGSPEGWPETAGSGIVAPRSMLRGGVQSTRRGPWRPLGQASVARPGLRARWPDDLPGTAGQLRLKDRLVG